MLAGGNDIARRDRSTRSSLLSTASTATVTTLRHTPFFVIFDSIHNMDTGSERDIRLSMGDADQLPVGCLPIDLGGSPSRRDQRRCNVRTAKDRVAGQKAACGDW